MRRNKKVKHFRKGAERVNIKGCSSVFRDPVKGWSLKIEKKMLYSSQYRSNGTKINDRDVFLLQVIFVFHFLHPSSLPGCGGVVAPLLPEWVNAEEET